MRGLGWIAYPAMAGMACTLISLGVITWVPALAATATTLRRWRVDGDEAVFTGVFTDFGVYWRKLWAHGLLVGVVGLVLVVNMAMLFNAGSALAMSVFSVQLGLGLVVVAYHLCLAAVAALHPAADPGQWRRLALRHAFGCWHGPVVLLAAVAITVVSLPLGIGPALFGPSVPLIIALACIGRDQPTAQDL